MYDLEKKKKKEIYYPKLTMLMADTADNNMIFFLFLPEKRIRHFIQIVS